MNTCTKRCHTVLEQHFSYKSAKRLSTNCLLVVTYYVQIALPRRPCEAHRTLNYRMTYFSRESTHCVGINRLEFMELRRKGQGCETVMCWMDPTRSPCSTHHNISILRERLPKWKLAVRSADKASITSILDRFCKSNLWHVYIHLRSNSIL